tara:strand:- start:38 stop:262 length:225 start_codon:yes stop_codon:yes gene_type:complete
MSRTWLASGGIRNYFEATEAGRKYVTANDLDWGRSAHEVMLVGQRYAIESEKRNRKARQRTRDHPIIMRSSLAA